MNILIVRLSAIGDIVMSAPFATSLRERYPEARIDWLVEPQAAALAAAHRHIDGTLVWPKERWQALWRERRLPALLGEMRAFARSLGRRYELALDLQGLMKSGMLAWMTRAPERIGLGSREGSAALMTRVVEPPRGDRRFGSEYRHLAEALALPPYRLAWPF
ncbi:MAG: lipopolysaccharide heptosyltransferase, partial [Gammaproteobacteria bacterium]